MATQSKLTLITLAIQICCFIIFVQPTTNETDLQSLLAIKFAIDLDPSGALDSWNITRDLCTWNGIQCGPRGRVIGLELMSQGLVGTLSPHIGNLSFLKTINLENNTFRGQIPQEITLLRHLQSLILDNNSFVGSIPTNLSQCPNLFYLGLRDNDLSGSIPTDLGSLSRLQNLILARNNLSGSIPPSLGNLTSLIQISLLSCGLMGEIPPSFAQLQNLKFLQLSDNFFTGTIPSSLFNISTIQYFYIALNQLSGVLPSTLGVTLPNLGSLYLWGNKFTGHIPSSISNASFLGQVDLSENSLTGPLPRVTELTRLRSYIFEQNLLVDDMSFISSLINCTKLEAFSVGSNMLTGSLPDSIANLSTSLSALYLYDNMIQGSIPLDIGNLVGLSAFVIADNDLDGSIPTSIAKLVDLTLFDASSNKFTNELPFLFGNLTSLTTLKLFENRFRGNLPANLGNCTSLAYLDLSHNFFNGLIHPEVAALSSISIMFNLSQNNFEGLIPYEVGLLQNLVTLDLSDNRLSGLIPGSLGKCESLQQLSLGGNQLEGEIPAGLSSLLALKDLDLSLNNLSGGIPSFLENLKLERLNLSFNRFQGKVPTKGVFKNMTWISVEGNELCGGIPELKLPSCPVAESHKRKVSADLLKILIPALVVGGIGLVLLSVIIINKRRKSRRNPTPAIPLTRIEIMRLSYADLMKATDGFSEEKMIGMGRFGRVYKGILEDETQVAVKVLNLSVRGASRSFFAECNSLRNIRHRNILKILSVCESTDFQGNDFKALVYEYKANGSLDKWLHQNGEEANNLDLLQRLNIAVDIAEALEYLHVGTDSAIVHGDLKPSNILVDDDMTACVGDFGLAKIILDMAPSHESTSIGIAGTLGYVAPEYAMDNMISTQGDVYSYGILLLEMFTNRRPTDNEFEDQFNLHNFVSNGLSNRIEEIVDPVVVMGHDMNPKVKECVTSILRIGIECSRTQPRDRMSITNVVRELRKCRAYYLS